MRASDPALPPLVVRPVRPGDERRLGEMMQRLSAASRRQRFHAAVNRLSSDALRAMVRVDGRRHLALVVTIIEAGQERIVADARYAVDASPAFNAERAEFAIVVDDAWQCRGVGERAMQALAAAATRRGLHWLHGSVMQANSPMLSLMRRCGFGCSADPDDDGLVHVERRLVSPQPRLAWPARWLAKLYPGQQFQPEEVP